MQKQNGAQKTKLKGVQTESLIGPVGCHGGIPKLMVFTISWMTPCSYSFLPCEKTSPQNSFPFLFCGVDISGHKDKMQAAIKPPNKIWFKVSRECIKLKAFPKYQKTQKESSWNSKEWVLQNKTESI